MSSIKNIIPLYLRLAITSIAGIISSRYILKTLGAEDFGIYALITGLVTSIGFLHSAMQTAMSRFITISIGNENFKNTINTIITANKILTLVIISIGLPIGALTIVYLLDFPKENTTLLLWLFLILTTSFAVNQISNPYTSIITSHEKFQIYGLISTGDATLRLIAAITLSNFNENYLMTYGFMTLICSIVTFYAWKKSCNKIIRSSELKFSTDFGFLKDFLNHFGWNVFGNLAVAAVSLGTNLLLHNFFGPAIVAARAASMQAFTAVNSFTINMQSAFNPKIIKTHSQKNTIALHTTIISSTRYNILVLSIISTPLIIETNYIVNLWLSNVPNYTDTFLKITLVTGLIEASTMSLITATQAVGKLKFYQITISLIILLNLPISYIALKLDHNPESVYITNILISITTSIARIFIACPLIKLSKAKYIFVAVTPPFAVFILCNLILYGAKIYFSNKISSLNLFIISIIFCGILTFTFGLTHHEKRKLFSLLNFRKVKSLL